MKSVYVAVARGRSRQQRMSSAKNAEALAMTFLRDGNAASGYGRVIISRLPDDCRLPQELSSALVDERRYGKVTRTVTRPEPIDPDSTAGKLTDAVLHFTIAKKPDVNQSESKLTNSAMRCHPC